MALFTVKIDEKNSLRGNAYPLEHPRYNLLLITGMQEYSSRYQPFAEILNKEGYKVTVLDHFGQGENAKSVEDQQKWPKNAWPMTLVALNNIVKDLRKDHVPVILMGHSMGSFFVQSYLETYPETVDKAILMGSNGPTMPYGLAKFLARLTTTRHNWDKPSRFIDKLAVGGYKVKGQKTKLDWLSYNRTNVENYIKDPYCGHQNTCGFYHEFLSGMAELYKKKNLARLSPKEKILIVSGEDDPVGGKKGATALYEMYQSHGVKDVTLKLYPKMRHEILHEDKAEEVIADLTAFMERA